MKKLNKSAIAALVGIPTACALAVGIGIPISQVVQSTKGRMDLMEINPSTFEQHERKEFNTVAEVEKVYFDAISKDPSIFAKDVMLFNEYIVATMVKGITEATEKAAGSSFAFVKFNKNYVRLTDLSVTTETVAGDPVYYLSYTYETYFELILLNNLFKIKKTFTTHYNNVPFQLKFINTGVLPTWTKEGDGKDQFVWLMQPSANNWKDSSSIERTGGIIMGDEEASNKSTKYTSYAEWEDNIGSDFLWDPTINECRFGSILGTLNALMMMRQSIGVEFNYKPYLGLVSIK